MRLRGRVMAADNWFSRHAIGVSRSLEILFGIVWGIDASFKFQPAFVGAFSSMMKSLAAGQPTWLSGWFNMWANMTAGNPAFFVYTIAALELILAIALVFGIARKLTYGGGFILSLLIWAVPEGFGGPYGPSSTDIGTGIIYAFVFIFLAIVNSLYGPNKNTIDYLIEKKAKWWKSVAEIKRD